MATTNDQATAKRFIAQLSANGAHVWQTTTEELATTIYQALSSLIPEDKLTDPVEIASFLEIDLAAANIVLSQQKPQGKTLLGLSRASLGIAATGTLALLSSPQNPTSLNFLVDYHLVLVNQNDLVTDLAEAMTRLTASGGCDARAINFVSGPSRTADIEQTIQLGAHGPRHLWVFLLG